MSRASLYSSQHPPALFSVVSKVLPLARDTEIKRPADPAAALRPRLMPRLMRATERQMRAHRHAVSSIGACLSPWR